ncbi:MAG: hypothetical protein BGO54_09290 [Sphingobacteriales bacterium 46-32]|nr:MAG: hypothetical protein BGO54_09290 [Sphingobacteriales bacterium 46-32]
MPHNSFSGNLSCIGGFPVFYIRMIGFTKCIAIVEKDNNNFFPFVNGKYLVAGRHRVLETGKGTIK